MMLAIKVRCQMCAQHYILYLESGSEMIYSIDKPCYPIKPYISFSFPLTQTPSLCQIVKMFGLVGVIFALCWLPYHSYFIFSYFHPDIMKVKRTIIRRSDIISQITLQRYYQEHSDLPFPLDISLLFPFINYLLFMNHYFIKETLTLSLRHGWQWKY